MVQIALEEIVVGILEFNAIPSYFWNNIPFPFNSLGVLCFSGSDDSIIVFHRQIGLSDLSN